MKINKLIKLNILLSEYQGALPFSDSDKSCVGVAIMSVRDKITNYYFKNAKK